VITHLLRAAKALSNFAYRKATGRSSKWPKLRDEWLQDNPHCEVCRTAAGCEVHHIEPFHLKPELELDRTNLMTLCRDHHFLFGHLMNWSAFNPDVVKDSEAWQTKIRTRPRQAA
jgi:5-methylcytosine-specific restriction protein A